MASVRVEEDDIAKQFISIFRRGQHLFDLCDGELPAASRTVQARASVLRFRCNHRRDRRGGMGLHHEQLRGAVDAPGFEVGLEMHRGVVISNFRQQDDAERRRC